MASLGVTGEVIESKQIEWKIVDFFSLSTEKHAFYSSPSFVFKNSSLHLEISPGGDKYSNSGFISLYLKNESDTTFRVRHTLHIKKVDGTFIRSVIADIIMRPSERMGYWHFCRRSELEEHKSDLAPSGILTVISGLKLMQDGKQVTGKTEAVHEEQTSASVHRGLAELDVLSENLRDLSDKKDSCDVVLEVENKEFKAHKAILMARSSVFAAMFQHDTLEKQTGLIQIPDCDSESFQEFLDYLYCGKLEDVSFRSAFHLYATSNKYDVQKLKEFCVEYLLDSLKIDNVCDIFKLADKYDETRLIAEAQIFFNKNLSRVFDTKEWLKFMVNNFLLANKLLVEYAKAKSL